MLLTKIMRVSFVLLRLTHLFPFLHPKLATLPSKFFQLVVFTSLVGYRFVSFPICKTSISHKAIISCKHLHIKGGFHKSLLKCRCMSFSIQKLRCSAQLSTALRNSVHLKQSNE